LRAPEGTPINAIAGGTVVTFINSYPNEYNWHTEGGLDYDPGIEKSNKAYANRVQILGDDGMYYLYAHNQQSDLILTIGQRVESGAVIGYTGNTGNSYGAHLHLEVRNTHLYGSNILPSQMWSYLP
jgi:murein DD-endopeptidase MepM/ murein hydrolase activator NlpD